MSIIRDKLGNEFLRNGGMEPNFPSSMIMFSHLPPITNFSNLAAHSVPSTIPQELILKKDPDSPTEKYPSEYMQPISDVKEKKFSSQDGFTFFKNNGKILLDEEEMHRGHSILTQNLNHTSELQARYEKDGLSVPRPGVYVKRSKKPNSQSQDPKPRRKRSDASKSSAMGADGTSLLHGPKAHICEHCCASFRSSYHLRRHVLIHTGERPFQCSQCSMCFIQKYLLQRHEKIHSGEKPFCCDQCNMRFIQKYHMERHKRTHSGEKPYQCHICQQYFSRTDRLLKHKRTCGDVLGKSENGVEPGTSGQVGNGHFESTQGTAGGRRRAKSKATSQETKEKAIRKKNKANISELPSNFSGCKDKVSVYNMQEYAVEMPMGSSSVKLGNSSEEQSQTRATKLVIKKVNRKSPQRTDPNHMHLMGAESGMARQKLLSNKPGSLELNSNANMDNIVLLQSTECKTEQVSSGNYDEAMQFFKKKRYLQAASSHNDYAVSIGQMASQQSVIQAAVASVMDSNAPLPLLDSASMNVDVKVCPDKAGIPDEVLQSLLDQYTHKHDVPFDISDQHVPIHGSRQTPQEMHEETACPGSHPPRADKTGMLQEYSKYLQQALERTSQSDAFSLSPGLQFCSTSLPSSLPGQTLFSDKAAYSTPSLECGFSPSVASVLPTASPKSHFGVLVSPQSGIQFPSTEATHQRLTPSQELAGQLDQQKNLEPGLNHQVYRIENFAQAFGSQFKSGGRLPMTFSSGSGTGEETSHRIRTTVSEFSGYTTLLSDANEPINAGAKAPTSQSYR
ncbi:zinc finger protein 281 [Callorhinchus milii]|uniref:zinc finger protein 281 n=1 Tax=Callorhinchus milii TaxID=7868 RepID=UPI001C3F81C6|nr:zinc finger protein 281 [Callorhinchus milii]